MVSKGLLKSSKGSVILIKNRLNLTKDRLNLIKDRLFSLKIGYSHQGSVKSRIGLQDSMDQQ